LSRTRLAVKLNGGTLLGFLADDDAPSYVLERKTTGPGCITLYVGFLRASVYLIDGLMEVGQCQRVMLRILMRGTL
jgi:hypothetical protein